LQDFIVNAIGQRIVIDRNVNGFGKALVRRSTLVNWKAERSAEMRVVRQYWEGTALGGSTEFIDPRGNLGICP